MAQLGALRHIESAAAQDIGLGKHLARRAVEAKSPGIYNYDAVSLDCLVHEMRNKKDGYAHLAVQAADCVKYFTPAARVEHRRRFIEHDTARLHSDYAGDSHALFLAAGKLMRLTQALVVHSDRLEGIVDSAAYLIGGYAEILGSERHIVLDNSRNYLVIGILEHHADLAADIR